MRTTAEKNASFHRLLLRYDHYFWMHWSSLGRGCGNCPFEGDK